jgi:hypothetical protein
MANSRITTIAERIYSSAAVQNAFEQARELFPEYNLGGEDTDKALDHILDAAQELVDAEVQSEEDVDALNGELTEMIHAGLT